MSQQKSDIKPYQAVLIITFFLTILITILYLMGERSRFMGASYLRVDGETLSVLLGEQILRFDMSGEMEVIPLAQFGIKDLVGGFHYFPNGDLLLRAQSEDLSVIDKLVTFLRMSGKFVNKHPDAVLLRCPVSRDAECQVINSELTFERSYRSWVLPDDEILVADTSNHRLLWLDSTGAIKKQFDLGLRFPNQIEVVDDRLVIANTNKHAISISKLSEFDASPNSIKLTEWSLAKGLPKLNKHTYPVEFINLEKGMVVLSQGPNLKGGNIYLLDSEGRVNGSFEKPEGADLISIAHYQGEILAADFSNYKIYRFAQDGRFLADFSNPKLESLFYEREQEFKRYDRYLNYTYAFGAAIFLFLLSAGGWLEYQRKRRSELELASTPLPNFPEDSPAPNIDDPDIYWIRFASRPTDNKWVRWFVEGITYAIPVAMFLLILMTELPTKMKLALWAQLVVFSVMFLGVIWYEKKRVLPRIGIRGDWISIVDTKNRWSTSKAKDVRYAENYLIVGDVYILHANQRGKVFDKNEYEKHLLPMLRLGRKLKVGEMCRFLWSKRDKQFISGLIVIPLMLVYFLLDIFVFR